ncbi:MAG: hypothetical protein HYY06_24150 [Deltaproteobacteria bacterium]|nr:hypothetical protein [Deltaproteobacteria bacterium]
MHDVDEEIREIKKEIIESRGLVIKTNNLTNALSADIKSIAKRQAGYERAFSFNSAAAYVLFAGLAFVGLHMAYDVRVREAKAAKDAVEKRAGRLKREVDQFRAQIDQRIAAEGRAETLYGLVREKKRAEAIAMYSKLGNVELSRVEAAFLRDAIDTFRSELALQAYRDGLDHARADRWVEAARAYKEAIDLDQRSPLAAEIQIAQAEAFSNMDRAREAMVILQRLQGQPENRSLGDRLLMEVAQAHIALAEFEVARETLRSLLRRYPRSRYSKDARELYQSIVGRN